MSKNVKNKQVKIAIISCFTLEHRTEYIVKALEEETKNVSVILSDFDHRLKTKIQEKKQNVIYINTKQYKKNLSYQRIYSHYDFAKKVVKELEKIKPDIIYSMIPPNFLTKYIIKYKRKNKDVKVIFDIIDLWPETLPFGKLKNVLALPLHFWRSLRDKNLKKADFVVTECNLYQKMLVGKLPEKTKTIYLADNYKGYEENISDEKIEVCHIGSINNIVDIDFIANLLYELNKNKKIKVHIVGEGEKRQELLEKLESNNIEYKFYGKNYDDQVKKYITNRCVFGINIMKSSTCVGLTMKSLEYFKFGLPILNNIKEDSIKLVEKYGVGVNVEEVNLEKIIKQIATTSKEDFIKLRENVSRMYKKEFEIEILKNKIKKIFEEIIE